MHSLNGGSAVAAYTRIMNEKKRNVFHFIIHLYLAFTCMIDYFHNSVLISCCTTQKAHLKCLIYSVPLSRCRILLADRIISLTNEMFMGCISVFPIH